ncbi:RIP metalloprotease RseP [Candidatus Kuenenbacteria bacterium CG11_big_fil_rev_8_21_14_0_20_37_9]|uniref:Zinc metalloprotease n=2 Tax=Candidatus Kueneniibacteriota TaxID=1752740 RepID=A0A2M6XSE0_9BACT|nr:MAG: RIP metalloprotease RseP [Candidatus Kuenenbacteria bacterium CG1_02_38_13]PIR05497.1 MAG: RIP metalloprotease RseP [Candidatus Kuenenbacteria bacterium CG11_big_fil_rev_8_21_14_0_20_37_9]PIU10552.1 MAG: RIP metalloprotease RseP [Candidatus Kuenenbacteria bacterium CG08_land_8_20_14_0_20_37_23]
MLITVIIFIIILGVLIVAHELGHFTTARIFKVKAEEFGFGYPPRIFGFVRKNDTGQWEKVGRKDDTTGYKKTVWSLNWLPFGGFVKIKGEDGQGKNETDSFGCKPIWQRFIILFAGVFMNFILCFVLLSIGFMAGIPTMVDDTLDPGLNAREEKIQIISVSEYSPASEIGLRLGDVILKIDDEEIKSIRQVQEIISKSEGKEIRIVFFGANGEETKSLLPRVIRNDFGKYEIGVGLVKTAIVSYPWYSAIYKGAEQTLGLTIAISKAFCNIISDLFMGKGAQVDVAGPVGIAVLTGQVIQLGWLYVLQFTALLSVNLAIINILPIPGLDGGRIIFLIIEKIKGAPIKQKIEGAVNQIGFFFILCIMVLVIFKDLRTYGSSIWNAIAGIF